MHFEESDYSGSPALSSMSPGIVANSGPSERGPFMNLSVSICSANIQDDGSARGRINNLFNGIHNSIAHIYLLFYYFSPYLLNRPHRE